MSEEGIDLSVLVARDGFAVVTVPEKGDTPDYAYSVGLFRTYGHPEIIVLGLPPATLEEIVETLAESVGEGHQFTDSSRSADVLEGYDVLFRSVSSRSLAKYFSAAIEYYGESLFPAVQCIWPDRAGRYPGEPRTRPGFSKVQPILGPV